ncbi:MAG: hypothetical protein JXR26_12220 [Balneolaceae bacterium]|nr:hypothetical protein [Balneolaceae bacterium]
MKRKITWKIFTNAQTEEKASQVIENLLDQLSVDYSNLEIKPYHKGGFTGTFCHPAGADTWSEAVIETLANAQQIGRSWILSGDIEKELDAWSNNSSITGVTNLHIILDN